MFDGEISTKKRFDVGALKAEKIRDSFCEKVCESVEKDWSNAVNGTGKWEVIRDGFLHAAESVLGLERGGGSLIGSEKVALS